MMKLLLSIILILLVWSLRAQIDSLYIEKIADKKILAPHTTLRKFTLEFCNDLTPPVTFQNDNLGLGIRFKREKIGVSLSFPIVSLNRPDIGQPRAYGFSYHIYPSVVYLQGNINYLSGFNNLNEIDHNEDAVFRPNDNMIFVNTTAYYAFNHRRYSLRSAFKIIDRQKQSAGSWVVAVPLNYQRFTADSLTLPLKNQADFQLDMFRSLKIGLNGGYAYSKVWGYWSVNVLVSGGVEFRAIKYGAKEDLQLLSQFGVNPNIQLTGSLVYNQRQFFCGLVGRHLPATEMVNDLTLRLENWTLRLMVGKRL